MIQLSFLATYRSQGRGQLVGEPTSGQLSTLVQSPESRRGGVTLMDTLSSGSMRFMNDLERITRSRATSKDIFNSSLSQQENFPAPLCLTSNWLLCQPFSLLQSMGLDRCHLDEQMLNPLTIIMKSSKQ